MTDTIAFRVIGERRDNPTHLLVVDDDGQRFDYDLIAEEIHPAADDGDWAIDVVIEESHFLIEAPTHRLAS